jgi:hypothetical protein
MAMANATCWTASAIRDRRVLQALPVHKVLREHKNRPVPRAFLLRSRSWPFRVPRTPMAPCDPTEVLVNGGGLYAVPNTNAISGRLASSAPSGSSWAVSCRAGQATAVALCAAKQQ